MATKVDRQGGDPSGLLRLVGHKVSRVIDGCQTQSTSEARIVNGLLIMRQRTIYSVPPGSGKKRKRVQGEETTAICPHLFLYVDMRVDFFKRTIFEPLFGTESTYKSR